MFFRYFPYGAVLLLGVSAVTGCDDNRRAHESALRFPSEQAALKQAYDDCFSRGLDYFMDIGSYPTLKSPPNEGREASEVVHERCSRTTTAFGNTPVKR